MHYPQVLVYEGDGRIAALLLPVVEDHTWLLREPRRLESCLQLLDRPGPGVLVIKAGRDLERELTLVERVAWLYPDAAVVFVGDAAHTGLAGLALDLGAAALLFPPQSRDLLADVVVGLM